MGEGGRRHLDRGQVGLVKARAGPGVEVGAAAGAGVGAGADQWAALSEPFSEAGAEPEPVGRVACGGQGIQEGQTRRQRGRRQAAGRRRGGGGGGGKRMVGTLAWAWAWVGGKQLRPHRLWL